MAIRNRHRVGDYLFLDDESGLVHYRSEMRQIWNGTWRHERNFETRQPQEFVRARNDPRALLNVRPEPRTPAVCAFTPPNVGSTTVPTKPTPTTTFAGVGDMAIEGSCGPFFVYSKEQAKT